MIATALRQVGAVGLALGIAAAASRAHAADASPWDGDARSSVRLIAGDPDGATLRAGVEIRLAPGWKTYWRYPGDSGVPPRFDFAQSSNVKSVTLSWPSPRRFVDDGGQAIGYEGDVIFPLRILANNPAPSVKNCASRPKAAPNYRLRRRRSRPPTSRRLRRPKRACRNPHRSAIDQLSPFAACRKILVFGLRASSLTWRRRTVRRSICSLRDQRLIGRYRCRRRSPAGRPACIGLHSISTEFRPDRAPKARS
jgi:hypothetical protein